VKDPRGLEEMIFTSGPTPGWAPCAGGDPADSPNPSYPSWGGLSCSHSRLSTRRLLYVSTGSSGQGLPSVFFNIASLGALCIERRARLAQALPGCLQKQLAAVCSLVLGGKGLSLQPITRVFITHSRL